MIADLRDLSDGDEVFLREVLAMYLRQSNEFVTAMRAALRANNTDLFKFSAHALGGSSLQTGAMQVANICHAIQCSEDTTRVALSAALETVEFELERVTMAVAQEGWRATSQ
jgi:HPt (histidine-containing phosphotransfer) domain-containing protein